MADWPTIERPDMQDVRETCNRVIFDRRHWVGVHDFVLLNGTMVRMVDGLPPPPPPLRTSNRSE